MKKESFELFKSSFYQIFQIYEKVQYKFIVVPKE